MNDHTNGTPGSTRRDYVKYGGAVLVGGLLAGCSGDTGSDSTPTATSTQTAAESGTASATETTYEACIEPVGCLTLEAVPETWMAYQGGWADMAFALGQRDGMKTANVMPPSFMFEPFGLDVPSADELPTLWADGWDKEIFYELDPDVILFDPNYMHGVGWDGSWDESDTEEIEENVAPFFGNSMLRRREFHDYTLYTLYEGFERLADLFQEHERYEAFATLHDEVQSAVQSRLPPESERTSLGLINGGSDPNKGTFYPMNIQGEGYEMKPYRDLGAKNAFPDRVFPEDGLAEIDYEVMLEVDPDTILVHWGIATTSEDGSGFSASAFDEQWLAPMEADGAGSQLTAVQEGRVYPGAYGEQGPITNLLQTEMVAQQLYPDEFGEFDPEQFPEVPEKHQLFDRERVIDTIQGDI